MIYLPTFYLMLNICLVTVPIGSRFSSQDSFAIPASTEFLGLFNACRRGRPGETSRGVGFNGGVLGSEELRIFPFPVDGLEEIPFPTTVWDVLKHVVNNGDIYHLVQDF